jgi:hypothetical protein
MHKNIFQKSQPLDWNLYRPVTLTETRMFKTALAGFAEIQYEPYAVSTRIRTGISYRFKCKAALSDRNEENLEAIVEIFKPIDTPRALPVVRHFPVYQGPKHVPTASKSSAQGLIARSKLIQFLSAKIGLVQKFFSSYAADHWRSKEIDSVNAQQLKKA